MLYFSLLLLTLAPVVAKDAWNNVRVHSLYTSSISKFDNGNAVVRDKVGFLWIATDGGLKRYDGYELHNFTFSQNDPHSIGSNTVASLYIDDEERLWVGAGQLNLYDAQTQHFTRFDVSDNSTVWAMRKDSNNIMWIGGEGFGLRGVDLEKNTVVHQFLESDNNRFINAIITDPNSSKLWICTNAGVYLFNPFTLKFEKNYTVESMSLDAYSFRDIVFADDGKLWIATNVGLVVIDVENDELKHYQHDPNNAGSLKTNLLWSVYKDNDGRIWIGTDKQGVHIYDAQSDQFFHIPASSNDKDSMAFPTTSINDIVQDEQGTMWFVMPNYGVRRISHHLEKFTTLKSVINSDNSLGFNNVLDIHQSKDGIIWIATDGGGLDRYDPLLNQFQHFRHDPNNPHSVSSNSVLSIDEDEQGLFWIGTYGGGINLFDPQTRQFQHLRHDSTQALSNTLANDNVFEVAVASSSQVYISVWRLGLQVYNPQNGQFDSYFPGGEGADSGISSFSINDIAFGEDNSVWLGGHGGFERFYPERKQFEKIDIGGIETVYDIYPDANHNYWLATPSGLVSYNSITGRHRRYTQKDGLVNDFVVSIEKDQQGLLWLGTREGLSQFDPFTEIFRNFTVSEGLSSNKFNRFSHLNAQDGSMYFGGIAGINVFNPDHMPRNEHLPNVVLTDIKINQRDVAIGDKQLIDRHISHLDSITLPYFQQNITLQFSALNFISPNQNHYQYRLLGLEDNWNTVDSNGRLVRYTSLDPGNYQFEVKASNNEGLWNPQSKRLQITVLPPWWQTWWMKVVLVIACWTLLYYLYQWRIRTNKLRAIALERQIKERTQQLKQSNRAFEKAIVNLQETQGQLIQAEKMASLSGMVVGIAHEVNTPLGVCLTAVSHIEDSSRRLFEKFDQQKMTANDFIQFREEIDSGSEIALNNIHRAVALVRTFKQVAADQSEENISEFNLLELLQDTASTVKSSLQKDNIDIHISCSQEISLNSYVGVVSQIVLSFIGNTMVHAYSTQTERNIRIEVTQLKPGFVTLYYCDDGDGIPAEYIDKVFEPFFTTNRKDGHTGLGMHITFNHVTQKLNGDIKIHPTDKGVKFEITIAQNASADP
ncbi:two-component regulator propeller domain-containing protein [Alteromonadaceae bacterium BrNp21-10]|nr:two-component regulator propeller domain-containing protein [Alteromonadaceae bacterium BrNp21-10]